MTNQELINWRKDPITQEIFKILQDRRVRLSETLCSGRLLDKDNSLEQIYGITRQIGILDEILSCEIIKTEGESDEV